MASIVAQHILPYHVKNRTVLSTKSIFSLCDGSVDRIYAPIGATVAVNTKERKYRFVEQIGNIYIERYCLLANSEHSVNDMDVLFTRIHDGGAFAKYLVNINGISRVLKDWRSLVDEDNYCDRSYFVNAFNVNGADNYLDTLMYEIPDIEMYPEKALSCFYQSDLSGQIVVPPTTKHPMQMLRDYIDARVQAVLTGTPLQLMQIKDSPDDVLCDTGKIKKIDFFSWLTRDGDLATSDLNPHVAKSNRWLVLQEEDIEDQNDHLLDLCLHYDVAYVLQLSCLTDFNLCYILPNRTIEFLPDESSVLCRYGNITENESLTFIHTLGATLQRSWPIATRIEVTKTWQNDAFITVTYNNTNAMYYVDLTIFALLSRSLSHL